MALNDWNNDGDNNWQDDVWERQMHDEDNNENFSGCSFLITKFFSSLFISTVIIAVLETYRHCDFNSETAIVIFLAIFIWIIRSIFS